MNSLPHGRFAGSAYRPLPIEALDLCERVNAPPRLVAHLILVHDAACLLVEEIARVFPGLKIDRDLILFGAATHDLGKAEIREELSRPGSFHERRGAELLRSLGGSEDRARFAITHGNWETIDPPQIEDVLVALADKCWKGKRAERLETIAVEMIAAESGVAVWE